MAERLDSSHKPGSTNVTLLRWLIDLNEKGLKQDTANLKFGHGAVPHVAESDSRCVAKPKTTFSIEKTRISHPTNYRHQMVRFRAALQTEVHE